jgi:hypothetical protein
VVNHSGGSDPGGQGSIAVYPRLKKLKSKSKYGRCREGLAVAGSGGLGESGLLGVAGV